MKRLFIVGAWVLAIGMTLHTLFVSEGWTHRERVRADVEALRAENAVKTERITELRRELTALRERPEVQEQAVRAELGFVRPTDLVLELPER